VTYAESNMGGVAWMPKKGTGEVVPVPKYHALRTILCLTKHPAIKIYGGVEV